MNVHYVYIYIYLEWLGEVNVSSSLWIDGERRQNQVGSFADQFAHQAVPLVVAVQVAVEAVRHNVELEGELEVIGQELNKIYAIAVAAVGLRQVLVRPGTLDRVVEDLLALGVFWLDRLEHERLLLY